MRICVVGGGLAGAMLAWRLAERGGTHRVDLILGPPPGPGEATAASGGAVRAWDPLPTQRRLALASLLELLGSALLQQWSGYREAGAAYLHASGDVDRDGLAEIERWLPGTIEVVPGPRLADRGWAGLPERSVAVLERVAGYLSPHRLRQALVAEVATRRGGTVREAEASAVLVRPDGAVDCLLPDGARTYDQVVIAAGAWTPALLRRSRMPVAGLRTKAIQYAVHPCGEWTPPPFVDESADFYGRPTADGGILLGCPTAEWDVPPGTATVTPVLHERAAQLASARFPRLRLGPSRQRVSATDCYVDPPLLALRPVPDHPGVHTFTGGSGGAAKSALAASLRAAAELGGR